MKTKLFKGKECLQPGCFMLITLKKEKQPDLVPSLPTACTTAKADNLNISDQPKACCTLVPFAKPTTALLPATLQYK